MADAVVVLLHKEGEESLVGYLGLDEPDADAYIAAFNGPTNEGRYGWHAKIAEGPGLMLE